MKGTLLALWLGVLALIVSTGAYANIDITIVNKTAGQKPLEFYLFKPLSKYTKQPRGVVDTSQNTTTEPLRVTDTYHFDLDELLALCGILHGY